MKKTTVSNDTASAHGLLLCLDCATVVVLVPVGQWKRLHPEHCLTRCHEGFPTGGQYL